MAERSSPSRWYGNAEGLRPPAWPRWILGRLSPTGSRGRLTILAYHRVLDRRDPLFPSDVTVVAFRDQMRRIQSWFNVLPLEEAVMALRRETLPPRALSITFDDGFADNADIALPVLSEFGLHATFFVASGFLDGGRMWNNTVIEALRAAADGELDLADLGLGRFVLGTADSRHAALMTILPALKHNIPTEREAKVEEIARRVGASLPTDLMMTSDQVRKLAAAGMGIGGHTVSHPILAMLDEPSARGEIGDGRDALEGIVRQPVRLFAYPNGCPGRDYRAAHVRMVQEAGFVAAVSTAPGAAGTGDDLYELPRFTPWGGTAAKWAVLMARNYCTPIGRAPE